MFSWMDSVALLGLIYCLSFPQGFRGP